QRHAAADTKAFDGADGDLLQVLPGPRQPRPELQVSAQGAEIHGLPRPAFGILQVKACAKGFGAAREHHDGSVAIILEAPRGIGELAQRFRRQRIDAVAAVETHDRDAALRPETLFDLYKIGHRSVSLPVIFPTL